MKTKMMVICIAAVLATVAVPASALYQYNGDMYAYLSSTRMEPGTVVQFGSTWVRNFTVNSVSPNPVIANGVMIDSFFDIFTEVSIDGGTTWSLSNGTGSITTTPTLRENTGGVQTWGISISELNATVPGLRFRESPTLSSAGTNIYKPTGGGYMISSFFDIFTEVSTNGGMTWQPVTGISQNYGATWVSGNFPMPVGVSDEVPVVIQSALNLFQPRIGNRQSVLVNDFHVKFRVNRWERNGYSTFLGGPMNTNYLNPFGYYGPPGYSTAVIDWTDDYIEIRWTFPDMLISDLSMPWFGFTFGNGIYGVPNGFRYQAVEWYWTYDGVRVELYDETDPDVWQDWVKVWNPVTCRWELLDVVVNRELVPRTVTLTAGTQMSPTVPLTIASLATGGPLPPNPVLPPPITVLPGNGGFVVTPWPWPGTDPYYYMYYDVANGATPGASFRNAVVLVPTSPTCPSADLNGDCFVNLSDLAVLASQWLTGIR